jgi:hypothetical protein
MTLPTTPADVTITAYSNVSASRTFMPAVDSVATAAGINNICGNRAYSIVETIPAAFTTITSPAPSNVFTTAWNLTFKTNLLSVVGVYTVTLQAKLVDYPSVTPATVQFVVTVWHICHTATITSQPMNPIPYQLKFNITAPTIQNFTMHADSTGFAYANAMICEIKTYVVD